MKEPMEELNPFAIKKDTPPSYETDVAKWYLIQKREKCSVWRWDSKEDETFKTYLVLKDNDVIKDSGSLEDILYWADFYEAAL